MKVLLATFVAILFGFANIPYPELLPTPGT